MLVLCCVISIFWSDQLTSQFAIRGQGLSKVATHFEEALGCAAWCCSQFWFKQPGTKLLSPDKTFSTLAIAKARLLVLDDFRDPLARIQKI